MHGTMIPEYRSPEFRLLEELFRLLIQYREGGVSRHLQLLIRFEISQFYFVLLGHQLDGEPEAVARLARQKKEILFNNLYYLNHAGRLAGRLKERGIGVMVLKGLSFINHLYGDIGMRPFCDLDLLIRREDVSGFLEVANEEGYTLRSGMPDPEKTDDFDLYNEGTRIKVDVLTTLKGGFYFNRYFDLDTSRIWERKKEVQIGETLAFRLSIEDELLYAIVHLAFHIHFHAEIKWFFDLRFLLEKYGSSLDRTYLSEKIAGAGLENVVFVVTEVLSWMFGRDHRAVFGSLKPRLRLFDRTWLSFYAFPPRLFGTGLVFPGVVGRMAITFMKYSLIASPVNRWKFIADRVFPRYDRITFAYTRRFGIPGKIFHPLIYVLFLILSPVLLTSLLAIYLGSTFYIRLLLLKYRLTDG